MPLSAQGVMADVAGVQHEEHGVAHAGAPRRRPRASSSAIRRTEGWSSMTSRSSSSSPPASVSRDGRPWPRPSSSRRSRRRRVPRR